MVSASGDSLLARHVAITEGIGSSLGSISVDVQRGYDEQRQIRNTSEHHVKN